jgi:hypothetical protein
MKLINAFVPFMVLGSGDKKNIMKQLHGEWLISHSNHPLFSKPNSKFITIYPRKKFILSQELFYGPILYSIKTSGLYKINGKNDCESALYDDESDNCNCDIEINWLEKKYYIESIFGIGVNEMNSQVYKQGIPENTTLSIDIIEPTNIYFSDHNHELHIVRNMQPVKTNSNTPLSTFVFAQILGSILLNVLHAYFQNIF